MNNTIEYRGYIIRVEFNQRDKEYPFLAIARNGTEEIRKRGYDEKQAIGLAKSLIDFTLNNTKL